MTQVSFKIDFSKSVQSELGRVLSEQFNCALQYLEQSSGSADADAIHEFRKTTKKLRALLRLVSDSNSNTEVESAIERLRSAAGQLADSRDAATMEQNLRRAYRDLCPDVDLSSQGFGGLFLLEEFHRNEASYPKSVQLRQVRTDLLAAAATIDISSLFDLDVTGLLKGMSRTYRKGRRLMKKANRSPSVVTLHRLRKRVKDYLYQLRLSVHLSPKVLRVQALEFDLLAATLGEHHDLAILLFAIDESRASFRQLAEPHGLRNWVICQMQIRQDAALRLAKHLFKPSTKQEYRRLIAAAAIAEERRSRDIQQTVHLQEIVEGCSLVRHRDRRIPGRQRSC